MTYFTLIIRKRFVRFIYFQLFKLSIQCHTLKQRYIIRKAYGVHRNFYPKMAIGFALFFLFILFGILVVSHFRRYQGEMVQASIPKQKASYLEESLQKAQKKILQQVEGKPDLEKILPYAFLVDKEERKLVVYTNNKNDWKELKNYTVIIGENEGQKQYAGDKRTPEGLYWIIGVRLKSELDSTVYGNQAYVLNYPNRFDKIAGRTGSGIWLHGTDRPFSRGCVTLQNNDLIDLTNFAQIGLPVFIVGKTDKKNFEDFVDPSALLAERDSAMNSDERCEETVYELIRAWGKAWESTDINQYQTFYSTSRFRSRDMDFTTWINYKNAIFQKTKGEVLVRVNNFKLEKFSRQEAVIYFNQIYKTADLSNQSRKVVELASEGGEWKIVSENVVTN